MCSPHPRTLAFPLQVCGYSVSTAARRLVAPPNSLSFIPLPPLRRSRRISEGMPESVAGACRRNREHGLASGSDVVYDDLGLARVPVPLERDRKTIDVASVKFNEHDAATLGCLSDPRVREASLDLSRMRSVPSARARVSPFGHAGRHQVTGTAMTRDLHDRRPRVLEQDQRRASAAGLSERLVAQTSRRHEPRRARWLVSSANRPSRPSADGVCSFDDHVSYAARVGEH